MVSPHALRASAITIFTIAASVAISFWAKSPIQSYRTQNFNRSRQSRLVGIVERRILDSIEGANLQSLDHGIVDKAKTRIREWLNAERRKYCNGFELFNSSGKVNVATQCMFNGQLQGLFEVRYRKEIFFARVSMAPETSSANEEMGLSIVEMVPGPCDSGIGNSLAVTVESK